ncbi:ABC-2 transporter permease [Clostridium sp. E02]|uniref:ABC-2 transporter permease n=1 Tax=Clostridium sp. E02 TaxID=2487134 RepID=UPI0013DD90BB|nr:ABC-2 transporter permease [Clostridium sp. E02]
MIGLLKKDMLLIVKSLSPIYFIAIMPPLMVSLNNPNYSIFIILTVFDFLVAMQIQTTMEWDERTHWKNTLMSMPIRAEAAAFSKYLLAFVLASFAGVVHGIVSIIILKKLSAFYIVMAFVVIIIYNALIIPVSFAFGTNKSKYFLIIFVTIPTFLAYLFKKLNINISKYLMSFKTGRIYIFSFCVLIVFVCVSIAVSIKALNKKE